MTVIMFMRMVVIVRVPMIVVVRMVVMVMTGCRHHGLEHFLGFLERDIVTLQHLADCEIIFHQQIAVRELGGEVQVADLPSPVSRFLGIGIGHLEHGFGFLLDEITVIFTCEKNVTVAQWDGKIEAKLGTVLRFASPTALGQYASFHLE